jgi:hypothetical protein
MTQAEIIEMARQAGFTQPEGETWYEAFPQCIEAFAKLVAAKEREACAEICDYEADDFTEGDWDTCCNYLAKKIRARGEA